MSAFFKIGLPWAFSLGLVFYLGLHFGGKRTHSELSLVTEEPSAVSDLENSPLPLGSVPPLADSPQNQNRSVETKASETSPPFPPNLIRIMQGAGILERMGSYLDALRSMDSSNAQDVVGAFEALPAGYGRHLEMKLLMRSWAAIDPEAALNYAQNNLDEKSERRFGISEALAGWANKDPDAAMSWALRNNSFREDKDNPFIVGVIKGISETDLEAANRILQSLPSGNAKWQSSTFLAQEYVKKSTSEAIVWANQFPTDDPQLRETILGQIGAKLARQDLQATASWAETLEADPANRRILDNLLTQWVSQNPVDASDWVGRMENEANRQYAMQQLASRWSLVDPVATAKWLNGFPPSASLDPVVGEFVNRISARDPEGAAGWALSIVEPESRKSALDKVMKNWKRIDPTRADAWMIENQIDP